MSQLSWKWLAGFFDGEGCISVARQNPGQPPSAVRLSISQNGVQSWVLDEINEFLETAGVLTYLRPLAETGQRDVQISEFDSVEYVLKRLSPHLIVKKARAEECLRYMREVRKLKKEHGKWWLRHVTSVPAPLRVSN